MLAFAAGEATLEAGRGDDGGRIRSHAAEPPAISDDALKKAEAYIEADEGALNRLSGLAGNLVTSVAVAMSLFHLYAAVAGAWPFYDFPIIPTQPLRYAHVAFVLMLSFLLFPMAARFRNRIRWWDVVLGVAGAAILLYAIDGGEDFTDRATSPTQTRHHPRRDLHRAAARGDAAHHRLDRAGHRARASSPTPISVPICRSPGRIAASTSASSSAICSSRSKASSAFRSTCRRR